MRSARPPPGDRVLCVFRQRAALRVVVDPARPGREGVFDPSPLPSRRPHPGEGGGREPHGRAGPEASDLSLEQDGLRHRPTPARPHPAATKVAGLAPSPCDGVDAVCGWMRRGWIDLRLFPSPLVGEGVGASRRMRGRTGGQGLACPPLSQTAACLQPLSDPLARATFSRKGRRK